MKVLSLFDGISGAQQALKNLGIIPSEYVAFEINKHAMRIAKTNFPNTFHAGDILKFDNFRAAFPNAKFDLVVFGSPCLDLSVGKKNRKSLKGPSSSLFFEAVEILREVKPRFFLMENVASMNQESCDEISNILGVEPVEINSKSFTFQNRKRLYWCNWAVQKPLETNTAAGFRSLLLPDPPLSLEISENGLAYMNRPVKGGRSHWDFGHHSDTDKPYSACVVSNFKKGVPYNVLVDKRFENLSSSRRWIIRKFHPVEVERLQGFPESYTCVVADCHRYEALGNSFTVPVIEHILKQMPYENN